jgi:hypothetical protein
MDPSKKADYGRLLLSFVPESGESVGNVTLRDRLKRAVADQGDELTDADYWPLRDALIDEGTIEQGRGRGGSVHRLVVALPVTAEDAPQTTAQAETQAPILKPTESSLYPAILGAITTGYIKDNRIKRFVSEITAAQGRRLTGGKWTRPDLTIIAVKTYQFTPGKRLEVISFEVKPSIDNALEGVYEALAHSAFAHRSYLAVDVREHDEEEEIPDDRIVQECTRHGVGYMTFTDPADYDTYEIVCTARLNEPDPYEVDKFIRTQISADNQDQIREFLQ